MTDLLLERRGDGAVRAEPALMKRILVVEDQPELQRALQINLRARLYEVMAARSGRDPRAAARSG